jgi:hypothetical protein
MKIVVGVAIAIRRQPCGDSDRADYKPYRAGVQAKFAASSMLPDPL